MRHARAHRGFTLLEILVAFVVLTVGVGILYRTFSTGLSSVDTITGYNEAIAIAEAKLGALGLEKPLAEGEESGTTDDHRYDWRVAVQLYTPPGDNPDQPGGFISPQQMFRATVTVTWNQRGSQKRSVELSTLRMMGKYPV
ncbi:MAG: prepilin-type N-terminal cleavage/methylation domain-containing protein [Betaproteobacteria bacterium]